MASVLQNLEIDSDSDDESGFKIPSYNIVPRLKAVVEAAVTEASEHLSRMDEAKMSEAAKSKSLVSVELNLIELIIIFPSIIMWIVNPIFN